MPHVGAEVSLGWSRDEPARRTLRVYAFDPQLANTLDRVGPGVVAVEVGWERLAPGPAGARVQVVDFDGGRQMGGSAAACYYEPVDLDDPVIAVQGGLAPSESDPRFHQQMVYAVAMRTLEAFDQALGRRLRPPGGVVMLVPHAFRGENAFYSPDQRAVLFGYFQADEADPGPNLPGQFVYTCLSHDIVVHEVTHAALHRIRPKLLEASNPDVAAIHEAISDLTAIFLHFTVPGVVADTVASTRTELRDPTPLVELAQQFGYATGRGRSLRTALDNPDPSRYAAEVEPHARGAILVAAVFEAFTTVYRRRIADLVRLATGGTGQLPLGALHPDLVNRVAREAIRTAQQMLSICVRALDYLPPLDVTFSDYLRSIVTADRGLFPSDGDGLRTALIDSFRRRGIFPRAVVSLADAALAYQVADWPRDGEHLPVRDRMLARDVLLLDPTLPWETTRDRPQDAEAMLGEGWGDHGLVSKLRAFAAGNLEPLGFDANSPAPDVEDYLTTFRFDENGAPQVRFIVQYIQGVNQEDVPDLPPALVNSTVRRGTTIVTDGGGHPLYIIAKPLPGTAVAARHQPAAAERYSDLKRWLIDREWSDPLRPFGYTATGSSPLRLDLARLHGALT